MCDFHSVIVTGEGRVFHLAENSHSAIARHNNLANGLDAKWWECEWNGVGNMPPQLCQSRGKGEPTALAERVAVRHYEKLALIVAGDLDPATVSPFDGPDYSDVRDAYASAIALRKVEPIAAMFDGLSDETSAAIIRGLVDSLSLDMSEIAEDEIRDAREAAYEEGEESGRESGYESGLEAACEDMYTQEYMDEQIEEAVEKAREEYEEGELEVAKQEAYAEGFLAAKNGATPTPDFINGLPAFLFT